MPWTYAAHRSVLDTRPLVGVRCGGERLALYALLDGIYATSDHCPHMGASLSYGCIVADHVECPMHHALFDIRTGAADGSVTARSVPTFPVKVEADDIYVDVPEVEESAT